MEEKPSRPAVGGWIRQMLLVSASWIADRMDLTLECIRRHYGGQSSPLSDTLERYADFFALFGDFAGYVEFFLLDDLLTEDGAAIDFFMPFDNFATPSVPRDIDSFREYRRRNIDFIHARNRRVAEWCTQSTEAGKPEPREA